MPGERQHQVPELAERACARGDWEERPSPVPARERKVRTGETRVNQRRVEPEPNAPQLIRLVQHPFALDTTRCQPDPERGRPQRVQVHEQVREPFGGIMRRALEDGRRLPFPKPTDLHPQISRPARPALADWLLGREEG